MIDPVRPAAASGCSTCHHPFLRRRTPVAPSSGLRERARAARGEDGL